MILIKLKCRKFLKKLKQFNFNNQNIITKKKRIFQIYLM